MGLVTASAVFTGIFIGLFIVICLFKSKPGEDINRWERWQQWLSNRRTPPGHGWSQFTTLHGAVELQHGNGTENGTTHATADDTADTRQMMPQMMPQTVPQTIPLVIP